MVVILSKTGNGLAGMISPCLLSYTNSVLAFTWRIVHVKHEYYTTEVGLRCANM